LKEVPKILGFTVFWEFFCEKPLGKLGAFLLEFVGERVKSTLWLLVIFWYGNWLIVLQMIRNI